MKKSYLKIIVITSILTAVLTTGILTLTKTLGANNNTIYTRDELSDIVAEIQLEQQSTNQFLSSYPVGSIYITASNNNPNDIGGTWVSFGEGKTLIGVGTGSDEDSNSQSFAANTCGGKYSQTLSTNNIPSHSHSFTSSNTVASANHRHLTNNAWYLNNTWIRGFANDYFPYFSFPTGYTTTFRYGQLAHTIIPTGDITTTGISGSNTIRLYLDGTSTPLTAGTPLEMTGGIERVTGNTDETGSNSAVDILQPYITVYMWKRTS